MRANQSFKERSKSSAILAKSNSLDKILIKSLFSCDHEYKIIQIANPRLNFFKNSIFRNKLKLKQILPENSFSIKAIPKRVKGRNIFQRQNIGINNHITSPLPLKIGSPELSTKPSIIRSPHGCKDSTAFFDSTSPCFFSSEFELFKKSWVFSIFTPAELADFNPFTERIQFLPQETIIKIQRENQHFDKMFMLLSGHAAVFLGSVLERYEGKGSVICHYSLDIKHEVVAFSQVEAYVIDVNKYEKYVLSLMNKRDFKIMKFLSVIPLFKKWNYTKLLILSKFVKVRRYKRNTVLYDFDDESLDFFLVIKGICTQIERAVENNSILYFESRQYVVGDIFGNKDLVLSEKRRNRVITSDSVWLYCIGKSIFEKIFQKSNRNALFCICNE